MCKSAQSTKEEEENAAKLHFGLRLPTKSACACFLSILENANLIAKFSRALKHILSLCFSPNYILDIMASDFYLPIHQRIFNKSICVSISQEGLTLQ